MIRILSAVYLSLTLLTPQTSVAAKRCVNIFTPLQMTAKIQNSIDRTISELAQLKITLDQMHVQGNRKIEMTALKNDYLQKEWELGRFLAENKFMTQVELLQLIKRKILVLQEKESENEKNNPKLTKKEQEARRQLIEKQIRDSIIDGSRAVFHRIEPGSFMMGNKEDQVHVTLTKPFELMATAVTKTIWVEAMRLGDTHLNIRHTTKFFEGDEGLLPVVGKEHSWVMIWIKNLNRLSEKGVQELENFIPGHRAGDIYRLPTEAEWEFVAKGRGTIQTDYHFGNDPSLLHEYGWFTENAGRKLHPVATLKPLMIGKKAFYDMHGNIYEMMQDRYEKKLQGGIDPQGPANGEFVVIRGGAYHERAEVLTSSFRTETYVGTGNESVGFRLVREVRK